LDLSEGNLAYLGTLAETERIRPALPLGCTGNFEGHELVLIGSLRRSVHVAGADYPFTEYLLYQPALGYRWLVESDGHWSYVTPLAAGDIEQALEPLGLSRIKFRQFQCAPARVEAVYGEFFWKVTPGELVRMTDH